MTETLPTDRARNASPATARPRASGSRAEFR